MDWIWYVWEREQQWPKWELKHIFYISLFYLQLAEVSILIWNWPSLIGDAFHAAVCASDLLDGDVCSRVQLCVSSRKALLVG